MGQTNKKKKEKVMRYKDYYKKHFGKVSWGVSVFERNKKVDEIHFKTEKNMAYWLYKNDK